MIDERLKKDLDYVKYAITQQDHDAVIAVEGTEGVGKSSLALQLCYYTDPTFDSSRIVFNVEQLKVLIRTSHPGQAILVDEAVLLFYSRTHARREQIDAMQILMTCRRKGQFIVLCIPQISSLEKYIIDFRLAGMFRCVKRGRVFAYSPKLCKRIRRDVRSTKLIYPRPLYRFSFSSCKVANPTLWSDYQKRRDEVINRPEDVEEALAVNPFKYYPKKIATALGVSTPIVTKHDKYLDEGEDYIRTRHGYRKYSKKGFDKLQEMILMGTFPRKSSF